MSLQFQYIDNNGCLALAGTHGDTLSPLDLSWRRDSYASEHFTDTIHAECPDTVVSFPAHCGMGLLHPSYPNPQ